MLAKRILGFGCPWKTQITATKHHKTKGTKNEEVWLNFRPIKLRRDKNFCANQKKRAFVTRFASDKVEGRFLAALFSSASLSLSKPPPLPTHCMQKNNLSFTVSTTIKKAPWRKADVYTQAEAQDKLKRSWRTGNKARKITNDLPTAIDLQSPAKCAFSNFAYKWSNIPNKLSICERNHFIYNYLFENADTCNVLINFII